MPKLFSFIRKYCIKVEYSKYSLDELLEAKKSIDKVKYAENFNALMTEFSQRENEINARNNKIQYKLIEKQIVLKTTCTTGRIISLFLFGLIFGFPMGLIMPHSNLDGSDVFASLIIMSMSGGLLFHSFYTGWTLGGNMKCTITDNITLYTLAQLIYAGLTGFSIAVFMLAVFYY